MMGSNWIFKIIDCDKGSNSMISLNLQFNFDVIKELTDNVFTIIDCDKGSNSDLFKFMKWQGR
jgi:hypothetical protein